MLPSDKPFLIGETAFHHQGDATFLRQLIQEGINCGVDALKFHLLFDLSDYFISNHAAYSALQNLMIPAEEWKQLHLEIKQSGVAPIYLCNDVAALQWVNSLPRGEVPAVEIHATGINDIFLLQEASRFKGTVIIGTGGSSLDEVEFAVSFLRDRGCTDIFLMHGFQNYPTDYKDINFSRMHLLRNTFNLPVGYADHTDPKDELNAHISCLALAAGFNVLEKHFTHVPEEKRVDAQAAVSTNQLKSIRNMMNSTWLTKGQDPLAMSAAERKYGDTGPNKKAIVARKAMPKGHLVTLEDIAYKRTNASVPFKQKDVHLLIGGETLCDIEADTALTFENIKYVFKASDAGQFFVNQQQ